MWPDLDLYHHTSDACLLLRGERIVAANGAALRLFGCGAPAQLLQSQLADFSPLQQVEGVLSAPTLSALLQRAHRDGNARFEWHCVGRDGRTFWVDALLTAVASGNAPGHSAPLVCAVLRETTARHAQQLATYLALLASVAARSALEARTRHLAEHDFLTDLPNRVLLRDRLQLALAAARRHRRMVAVLFIDLDRFKRINDSLGHHVGDLLLREAAARLVRCVRSVDTVSRQGGDEFVVILADLGGIDQAAHVAATIGQALAQGFLLAEQRLHVSASIGISIFPGDGADSDTLLQHADLAMYHAKAAGRDGYQFFSPEMHAHIAARVALEHELRLALEHDQFMLAYEAQVDLTTLQPLAAEALLRWRHPRRGLLLPAQFMGAAEDAGLMVAIGDWVLAQACLAAARWRARGQPLVVAVNLSRTQFLQKNLVDKVSAALAASGLPPALLELELTEAIIMDHDGVSSAVVATLDALRALGVRVALDDFGTGYTRVGRLRDYPVGKLKIDPSFVSGSGIAGPADGDGHVAEDGPAVPYRAAIPYDRAAPHAPAMPPVPHGAANAPVVIAIIALARSLGLTVLAEGVETDAQFEFLRGHGCDQYQGRYARASGQLDGLGDLLD